MHTMAETRCGYSDAYGNVARDGKRPSGKRGRLILLHAGTVDGWVPEGQLVFHAKSSTGNYHNEMNILMEWWKTLLLSINSTKVLMSLMCDSPD